MSRISRRFEELAARKEKALIAYVMAGYPDEKATDLAIAGLARGGADIIELGFPFSDPLADGPVIQEAGAVSMSNGMGVQRFLETVRRARKRTDVPLVLMTYTNILYRQGYQRFVRRAVSAGIDGFILPDMPVEESARYLEAVKEAGADAIFLVSPNTDAARIRRIAGASSGFLYMVAVYGTTGARTGIRRYTVDAIRRAKKITGGGIPVGVGFGISAPRDVKGYVSAGADAVIVGSAFLKLIGGAPRNEIESRIAAFTKSLKRETRAGRGRGRAAR